MVENDMPYKVEDSYKIVVKNNMYWCLESNKNFVTLC